MEKEKLIFGGLVLLAVALVIFVSFPQEVVDTGNTPGPPEKTPVDFDRLPQFDVVEEGLEIEVLDTACIEVMRSGSQEEMIDVVFVGDQYGDLDKFRENVLSYIDVSGKENGVFAVEPFKSNIDKFNFYYVNQSVDLSCELGCFGLDRLVCCDDNEVKNVASQCPSDQVIVLVDTKEFCGASKDYSTVCAIDDPRAGLVLVHELGHTIGDLGDEYSYGVEGETDVANCDVEGCSKWAGLPGTGCFKTCGYTNFYRPTNEDSLMNIYVPHFGPVAEIEFQNVFDNFESGEASQELVAAPNINDKSYIISLSYFFGKIKLEDIFVANATFEEPLVRESHKGVITDFEGKRLKDFDLRLPDLWYTFYSPSDEDVGEHSAVQPQVFSYTFKAPYYSTGKLLEIYDLEGEKLDEISLAPFAEVCGDGVCQEHENFLQCSLDCPLTLSDDICLPYPDDNVCDPDCPKHGEFFDQDCKENIMIQLLVIAGILAIAFITLFLQKMREDGRV